MLDQELNVTEQSALVRKIVHRTRGTGHGPITRLMSPGDLGETLKPFVFLDHFESSSPKAFSGFGLHPHSGIATLTYIFDGGIRYADTTGASGILPAGGVEWFKAAHGAWHGGGATEDGKARGFQLWLALPPDQELGAVESRYLSPESVPATGPARVLLGEHEGAKSAIAAPGDVQYLAVELKAGERWRFAPGKGQTVAWAALSRGSVLAPERLRAGDLAVFEAIDAPIDFTAETDSAFVIGAAVPHEHDLVLGYYSVHTSSASLAAGEQRIIEIRDRLRREGRLYQTRRATNFIISKE